MLPNCTLRVMMSALGQSRRFRDVRGMSGLPPTADISGHGRHFAFVPKAEIVPYQLSAATDVASTSKYGLHRGQ